MSGRRVNGRGTKIVLVGSEREVECFIGTLKDQKEVIELARGWGIVGGDKVVATITTGTADQVSLPVCFRPLEYEYRAGLMIDRNEIGECLYYSWRSTAS
jgi:hypothetical protein